jgi:CheY-like chemotaxis protein
VITNLVANAAKVTQHGHVTLSIDLDTNARPARALLRVEDSGPGIAPAQQVRVFDPFVQADASLTRQHGGAGLGLAIARRLAQAMGGDVVLERSSAKGSSFVFSWPVTLAEEPLTLPAPKPGLAWLLHRPAAQGAWLAARLRREGWQSELFDSVTAAVAATAGKRPAPDLVVVNEQSMTEHTDLAALRKALPRAQLALLVRPDWHQPQIEAQATALNIAIIVVPLTPADIRRLLLRATPSPRRSSAPTASPAATPGATVMVVEDNKVNRLIVESFVRELGCTPVCAEDGAAALQACTAQPPSLVLMDLQMPVMDGFEAARQMRAQQAAGRLPRFPIVALTAHAGEADREAARAAGMDDYLTKPLLLDSLRATLARWIGVSR